MKQFMLVAYRYREGLREEDFRKLTKEFGQVGTPPGVIAHYERFDGRGGFLLEEMPEHPETTYEKTIQYGPWMEFEIFPVTTMEDAFPVIQRVYG